MSAVRFASLLLLLLINTLLRAHEGMWLPTLLKSIEGDLRTAGLRITAEDIYSVNRSSIKDAVVLFGGGCTAGVIGREGLILTNHHCGFGSIQRHSSLEHDYLKHGFWAKSKADELVNPGLTATFVIRIEDVTDRIVPRIPQGSSEPDRREWVDRLAAPLVKEATAGTHYKAVVRPFNHGNSYFLILTETFRDVRLVGAPPGAIGKFGGDTDNWMWPRHTGDMSLFRIYAGPGNTPADPSPDNVPFVPRHVLPISLAGASEGAFAMIFGFPGNTQQHLTSHAVRHVVEVQGPLRIAMRRASLAVIDQAMRASDRTRIQYAAKQSSISNAYKKWIGELRGLKELRAVEEKEAQEQAFLAKARAAGREEYAHALDDLREALAAQRDAAVARDLYVEMVFYGPEVLRFAEGFHTLLAQMASMKPGATFDSLAHNARTRHKDFWKDYDAEVDRRVFKALLPIYRRHMPEAYAPDVFTTIDARFQGNADAWIDDLYARSVFVDRARLEKALARITPKGAKALMKDPGLRAARSFHAAFLDKARPVHLELADRIEAGMRTYVRGLMELHPERAFWPDANGTLRLSYGKVEGSSPRDAVDHLAFTTLDGILEKHVPGDPEFEVPQRLLELHRKRDYGPYGDRGTLPVCFTASLHTTGGNSGSPVLNARGELIGLNFDRTWESTMSDIRFDPAKCRNISMDARYILFIIDRFAEAGHLLAEMDIVRPEPEPRHIELPIHR